MAQVIAFFQAHGIATVLIAFTIVSIILNAVANVLKALGKTVPGWIGTVLDGMGSVTHFLNGNVSVAKTSDPAAK